MINALIFFALLMILHYSLTILNIIANALSLIFFINANTLLKIYLKKHELAQTYLKFSIYLMMFFRNFDQEFSRWQQSHRRSLSFFHIAVTAEKSFIVIMTANSNEKLIL